MNALLLFSVLSGALSLPLASVQDTTTQCTNPCNGVESTNHPSSLCGNKFLGPAVFTAPSDPDWSDMFAGYDPLAQLCPTSFLKQWTTGSAYIYPPDDGALLDSAQKPVITEYTLQEGYELDRFGSQYGGYLAPRGTPFAWRSIPPGNLNPHANSTQYNYWVWRVKVPFNVTGGPIAPWFGQPGFGLQFYYEAGLGELESQGFIELVESRSCPCVAHDL
ncbi:hypothetical protein BDV25DRAFT_38800 [Aspergillus avenaceus]|uniref:TNT domain-containing protein n=1 Tax=Aspergillus avenaceus TaxID=36643 RepID=A0A5N6U3K8_ASPAV|nr:hypothetical protein BDV25DRAFT_38800 [Aspergillus avenaceus]